MDKIWNEMYEAAMKAIHPRAVSRMIEAGGVAAAVESTSGRIYVGVCVDTACTLGICAERNAVFSMITNGEDHHAHKLCVQQRFGHLRIVGGKADVPNRGFFLQGANVIQHAAFYRVFHVLFLIHAVQKVHVHIIGAQLHQFPIEGLLNFRQVLAPAVFALFVICRAEMQSEKHLVLG